MYARGSWKGEREEWDGGAIRKGGQSSLCPPSPTRFPGERSNKKIKNQVQRIIKIESASKNFRSKFGNVVGITKKECLVQEAARSKTRLDFQTT